MKDIVLGIGIKLMEMKRTITHHRPHKAEHKELQVRANMSSKECLLQPPESSLLELEPESGLLAESLVTLGLLVGVEVELLWW